MHAPDSTLTSVHSAMVGLIFCLEVLLGSVDGTTPMLFSWFTAWFETDHPEFRNPLQWWYRHCLLSVNFAAWLFFGGKGNPFPQLDCRGNFLFWIDWSFAHRQRFCRHDVLRAPLHSSNLLTQQVRQLLPGKSEVKIQHPSISGFRRAPFLSRHPTSTINAAGVHISLFPGPLKERTRRKALAGKSKSTLAILASPH